MLVETLSLVIYHLPVNYSFLTKTFPSEWSFAILTDHKNFCHSFRLVLGQLFILRREGKEMWTWLIKVLFCKAQDTDLSPWCIIEQILNTFPDMLAL